MRGTDIARLPELVRGAQFSDDQVYRYTLTREWGYTAKSLNMIMLNPSVADTERDDRTICRVMEFAHREGFRYVTITNIFGLRATSPKDLHAVSDPVGPGNDWAIRTAAMGVSQVWVGWGTYLSKVVIRRMITVQEVLHDAGVRQVYCLGENGDGSPRHPLYTKGDTPLVPWRGYW